MIPKVIHYCWFGQQEKPELVMKCINSWKKYCPDYQIIEWNETNINLDSNKYIQQAYENHLWAYLTDYLRLEIVYKYGGIYFDTDVELVKEIDDLLESSFYLGYEHSDHINTGLGFGAEKENKIIKLLLDEYTNLINDAGNDAIEFISCPVLNTRPLYKLYGEKIHMEDQGWIDLEGGRIFSTEFFCPKNFDTKTINITDNTYSIHHYEGSWLSPIVRLKKNIKSIFLRVKNIVN